MEVYFDLIICVLLLGTNTLINSKDLTKRIFIFFSIGIIILLQGLRKETVGIDLETYVMVFEMIASGETNKLFDFSSSIFGMEFGYIFLNKIIALFTQNSQLFIVTISTVIFVPMGYVIYKNSRNLTLSIISLISLIIFNFSFSGLRQSIALAMTFLSFELIRKRKLIWFILLILLASSFHKSALVFFVAYFLYDLKFKRKHFIFIFIFIGTILVFKLPFLGLLSSLPFFNRYSNYEVLLGNGTGAYTMFAILLFIYSFSMLIPDNQSVSKSMNAYRNYILVAVIIQITASLSPVVMRSGYYYFIFLTLLLPELVVSIKNKRVRYLSNFMVLILCLSFYYLTTVNGALNPYLFYWE